MSLLASFFKIEGNLLHPVTDKNYMKSNYFFKFFLAALLSLSLLQCGGATTQTSEGTPQNSESNTNAGLTSNLNFNFTLSIDISTEENTLSVDFDEEYTLPLTLSADGTLQVEARDFEPMIFRACGPSIEQDDCDGFYEEAGAQIVDLVIDACGQFVDNENCVDNDTSIFSGLYTNTGSLVLGTIWIRMRGFVVSDSSDGFSASPGDSGSFRDIVRIPVYLTTGSATSGDFDLTGSKWDGSSITLVSAGNLSSVIDSLGLANYGATITGAFDTDPNDLLAE